MCVCVCVHFLYAFNPILRVHTDARVCFGYICMCISRRFPVNDCRCNNNNMKSRFQLGFRRKTRRDIKENILYCVSPFIIINFLLFPFLYECFCIRVFYVKQNKKKDTYNFPFRSAKNGRRNVSRGRVHDPKIVGFFFVIFRFTSVLQGF